MAIRIAVGDENFDEIRKAGLYYVDKTELLYDLVGRTDHKVTLFTRPRRFGKTLNMSMMESIFDINRDSKTVFEHGYEKVISYGIAFFRKTAMIKKL